jgi:potassium-transporting ATPase KdpC subunit
MQGIFKRSILMTLVLLVLTCGIYPLGVWVVGQIVFHHKANGSIVSKNGNAVGSELIAQNFQKPEYFHPRPSSAGDKGYDAANSSGSNLAMTNKKFIDGVAANVKQSLTDNPGLAMGQVPNDMVMGSGSGLDPDITSENAMAQAPRVASARKLKIEDVQMLIDKNIQGPDLGILGEKHVNVLKLNLALGEMPTASK